MNRTTATYFGLLPALLVLGVTAEATAASPFQYDSWQERRLMEPKPQELENEERGKVFIYDGLEATTVDRAMDQHFDRIDSMMFTRVQHPPPSGNGPAYVVDDGCD
jgi:hypothetical protein